MFSTNLFLLPFRSMTFKMRWRGVNFWDIVIVNTRAELLNIIMRDSSKSRKMAGQMCHKTTHCLHLNELHKLHKCQTRIFLHHEEGIHHNHFEITMDWIHITTVVGTSKLFVVQQDFVKNIFCVVNNSRSLSIYLKLPKTENNSHDQVQCVGSRDT